MRIPSNYKFKKKFGTKLSRYSLDYTNYKPSFGNYYLKSTTSSHITENQVENVRIFLKRKLRKGDFFWIKVFPWSQITKKSSFSRMGKGKGVHFKWVTPIKSGRVIFEIISVLDYNSVRFLSKSFSKLGVKIKVFKVIY